MAAGMSTHREILIEGKGLLNAVHINSFMQSKQYILVMNNN